MKSQFEPTTAQHPDGAASCPSSVARRASRVLRQLEPAVAGTIAALTGCLAATSHADMRVLWIFSAVALAVALWTGLRRQAGQVETTARAMALLAASYVLHTVAGAPGGAAGVFFFWLGLPTLYYVFVLKTPFGSLVAVAAVAEFTLATLWAGEDALSLLAARGAFLLIVPMLLTMKLGSLWRRLEARADHGRRDSSTALFNRGGLLAHGPDLLARCRAERGELTLAVFDCGDLLEARVIYGARTTRQLVDSIVGKLALLAGSEGLAARTGPTQFAVAMPMSRDRAVQVIERALGNPCRFEIEGCKSEIVLVPHLMVEAIPVAGTVDRMFSALCRGLARVQEEERKRQRYLQRERERHSRPMAIRPLLAEAQSARRAAAPRLGPDPEIAHQIPRTVPMPLATR